MGRERGSPAPLACMVATIVWTWTFLGLAILTRRPWLSFPAVLLTLAGFLGPVVMPSLFILAGRSREPFGAFWRRCLDPTTLRPRWYVVVIGLVVALVIVPAGLTPGVTLGIAVGPLAFLVVGMLAGAAEEPAWRGYGQAALQDRLPVVTASLIVGVLWAAWHLPMFWLEGTYQHGLGVGTSGFWTFLGVLVVSSPIYAWLVNASGHVVFAAVLFHAAGNVAGELIADAGADILVLSVTGIVALLLVRASWPRMSRPVSTPQARDGHPRALRAARQDRALASRATQGLGTTDGPQARRCHRIVNSWVCGFR
jgi:uncharacterized protein